MPRSLRLALAALLTLPFVATSTSGTAAAASSYTCLPGHGVMSINSTQELMAGRVHLPGGTVVSIGTTGDTQWGRSGLSASNARLFLSMSWANLLARSANASYVARALALAEDFARDNPVGGGPDPADAWTPMYAGQRTSFLACLSLRVPDDPQLRTTLARHGGWLASPAGDAGDWNQGLDAALGLLAAGCRLDNTTWQETASARFARMIKASIDAQGAFNEQAPGYAGFVYDRWDLVARKLTECGRPVPPEIAQRRPLLLDFLAWATQPDGRLAQIGDTQAVAPRSVPGSSAEYAATRGASGTPLTGAWKVYSAGYVFGRSTWAPYPSGVHYSLRFGPGRAYHGHNDHQSLTFAVPAGVVLTEAGHSGYSSNVQRHWQRSPFAHNVLTLPGVTFNSTAATRLTRSTQGPGWQWWEVSDTAYGGRARTRGVLVDPAAQFALVQDRASRASAGAFQQLWHLPKGTAVSVSGRSTAVATSADGRLRTVIRQVALPGQTLPAGSTSVVKGRSSPLQGWVSRQLGEFTPAPTVVATRNGTSARVVTLVAAASPGTPVSARVEVSGNGWLVTVTVGSTVRRVGLSSAGGMWLAG